LKKTSFIWTNSDHFGTHFVFYLECILEMGTIVYMNLEVIGTINAMQP